MSDPIWIPITGMVTGVIGAVTGIAGAIMGFVSLQKVNTLKSLDLRLELRKAENEARATLAELDSSIGYAKQSKENVLAARGMFESSMMEEWHERIESDRAQTLGLISEIPALVSDCLHLSPDDLESRLVAMHGLQLKISSLLREYQASLASDDEEQKLIRSDIRKVFR